MATTHDPRFPDPTTTGTVPFDGGETWYRVTGSLGGDVPPLVVLHGGPGVGHNYTLMMANLATDGRAVVHYDQFGCGASTHRPDAAADFWTVELFVRELRTLLDGLGIERFHLLGQSWGGMLAPEFVLADGAGVQSLTLCDSPASMQLWGDAARQLRAQLPSGVEAVLDEHEAAGTTDDTAYLEATKEFYDRHVCRVLPNPPELRDSFTQLEAEPTVYHTMNGPNEFHVVGTMRHWSIIDRLTGIDVPTLVIAGAHDEAMPHTWQPFVESIPDVRSHVFAESSHMPHIEEPEAFMSVVGTFLNEHDPKAK